MKQVIQNFKSGQLYVDDVPIPAVSEGFVLVKNAFSLISAGTEKRTVSVGKAGIISKAKQRPDLVAQVMANVKKEGINATLKKVRTKLDSLKELGYSSSGIVEISLDKNGKFKPGDKVACAGQNYASHAEFVSVPKNLITKIPEKVSLKEACFTTLGGIALQGIRQADPKLGDNVCVIGLGLLGLITCQLLKANGCHVMGIDISDRLIEISENINGVYSLNRNNQNLLSSIQSFTKGFGFDSVIITAASDSNDPVELAGEILRKKGIVIIVGAVNLNIPRDPDYYQKELEIKMSTSYGPGRYDQSYEEGGIDYPYGYVRWTEQRNMEAFLSLIADGKINLNPLITHLFDITEAQKAYDIILGQDKEPYIAIVLNYSNESDLISSKSSTITINKNPANNVNVGMIGAGSFAQSYLIPHIQSWNASLDTVVTTKGITSKKSAEKFNFNKASTNPDDVINNDKINTVFVATRHNSHAEYVLKLLNANKHVFVEKPLAINKEDLMEISEKITGSSSLLMVGFNRRFAPVSLMVSNIFNNIDSPLVINYRINAGYIPKDHWTQNSKIGGGRIIGEICHFIDLMQYFTNSDPEVVYAHCVDGENNQIPDMDNISVNIKFKNGSIGNILYLACGNSRLEKELVEIYGGGNTAVINDFKSIDIYQNRKHFRKSAPGKGHKEEIFSFLNVIKEGGNSPISFSSIFLTTMTTFKILDSLSTGLPQKIE